MSNKSSNNSLFTNLKKEKELYLRARVHRLEDRADCQKRQEQALRERVKKLERTQEALFVALATVAFVAILAVCVAMWKVVV